LDIPGILKQLFDRFERVLRWGYPGLLFWLTLPIAASDGPFDVGHYADFYNGLPIVGHVAVIVAAGVVIYSFQRYIIHQITSLILYCCKVGPAANYPPPYSKASGRHAWRRFGLRPSEKTEADAEDRFSEYLISRWAGIHALCNTWIIGLFMYLVGTNVTDNSIFSSWSLWARLWYLVALVFLAGGYFWQSWITAHGEAEAYPPLQSSDSTTSEPLLRSIASINYTFGQGLLFLVLAMLFLAVRPREINLLAWDTGITVPVEVNLTLGIITIAIGLVFMIASFTGWSTLIENWLTVRPATVHQGVSHILIWVFYFLTFFASWASGLSAVSQPSYSYLVFFIGLIAILLMVVRIFKMIRSWGQPAKNNLVNPASGS